MYVLVLADGSPLGGGYSTEYDAAQAAREWAMDFGAPVYIAGESVDKAPLSVIDVSGVWRELCDGEWTSAE